MFRSDDSKKPSHGLFTKLSDHIVFGTKFRSKLILPSFSESLYEYIGGIIRNQKGSLIEAGGIEDHIHLLVRLSPSIAISKSMQEIKGRASKWINETQNIKRNLNGKKVATRSR